jgi:hypothetical protein
LLGRLAGLKRIKTVLTRTALAALMFTAALWCGGLSAVADTRPVKSPISRVAPGIADPVGPSAKMPLPLATGARLGDLSRRGGGTFASTMRPLDLRQLSMSDFGDIDAQR